ncbi:MAG: hypothetical protein JXR27_10615 [Paludibacteraceae bacterium]|nr:hypothetical protein [Paludibacteraceae bacterium]
MNLFWKILFGKITPTAKIEQQESDLQKSFERYLEVEKSLELAEYKTLFHEVKAPAFIENKKTLQNRKYRDTEEYRDSAKYKKLAANHDIKTYYEVLASQDLESFLEFKKSAEYEDLGDMKKVKSSEKLQRMKAFEKSNAFKVYSRFHDSYIIKEYEQLKVIVSHPEFVAKNEFWANAHRWQTTPEFAKEQRFYELDKNPDIIFYNKQNSDRFNRIREQKVYFDEQFDWNTLDKSHWNYGFAYKSPSLLANHSFANEKQANNSGKNISVVDGKLRISTEKETIKAPAWHTTKGFIEEEFEYTSDVLQSAASFRQKKGKFSAKIRCTGNLQHAFWLGADKKLPHINVFHWDGKKIKVGNAAQQVWDGVEIKGINPANFYIYSLEWTEKELIWSINNYEVYRTAGNLPKEEMYLAFSSFIPEKMKGDTGILEVDWVKVTNN